MKNSHLTSPLSPSKSAGRAERLTIAMTWARLFLHEAERELKAMTNTHIRAAAQTVCAIEQIDPKHDELDGHCQEGCSCLALDGDTACKCTHTHFMHKGTAGGMCLAPECKCGMFTKE